MQKLLACYAERRTESGHAGVVRNGYLPERELQTSLGPVTVRISKVWAKTGEPVTFQSALVPPYVRKTRSLEAARVLIYFGGANVYYDKLRESVDGGFPELEFERLAG